MINFPPDFAFQRIQPGQVYLMRHPDYPEKDHYFVVANHNPTDDDNHIVVVCTSQVDRIKRYCSINGLSQETVVEVEPHEHESFDKCTAINCNNAELMQKSELMRRYEEYTLEIKPPISQEILNKVRTGILKSPRVKRGVRNLLIIK